MENDKEIPLKEHKLQQPQVSAYSSVDEENNEKFLIRTIKYREMGAEINRELSLLSVLFLSTCILRLSLLNQIPSESQTVGLNFLRGALIPLGVEFSSRNLIENLKKISFQLS